MTWNLNYSHERPGGHPLLLDVCSVAGHPADSSNHGTQLSTQTENIAAAGLLPTDNTLFQPAQQLVLVFVALAALFLLLQVAVMVSGVNSASKSNTAYRK